MTGEGEGEGEEDGRAERRGGSHVGISPNTKGCKLTTSSQNQCQTI